MGRPAPLLWVVGGRNASASASVPSSANGRLEASLSVHVCTTLQPRKRKRGTRSTVVDRTCYGFFLNIDSFACFSPYLGMSKPLVP